MPGLLANRIAPLGIGIVGGAAATYLYLGGGAADVSLVSRSLSHPATRWGVPQTSVVQRYSNFVSQVDYRTKNPAWVLEHLDERQTESKVASRRSPGARYHEDEGVDERFRAKLAHYRQSGYDRGHMSPAMNNKNSEQAMAESFSLSNMAPQVGKGFNRDYWARFEMFINRTVVPACKDVYVVTGPLYLENAGTKIPAGAALVPFEQRTGGENDNTNTAALTIATTKTAVSTVAVPTHFYKVILGVLKQGNRSRDGSDVVVGAFVMPNAQIHPKTPLSSFQVPLRQLELVAGIDFFPKLDRAAVGGREGGVCSLNGCELPPEQFWLEGKKNEPGSPTKTG